jgi:DNA repair photolyase
MKLKWEGIESIEKNEPKEVFDITCRGNDNFFSNGILVHNCSYNCRYCFSALTVSSLMTAFFDSDEPLKPRYSRPETVREQLDDVLKARGVEPYERKTGAKDEICGSVGDTYSLKKAAAQRIPLRFGTRSENFLPAEKKYGVALEALKVVKDHNYPLIINTKSDLPIKDPYFKIISEMGKNVAIQVSIIHTDDKIGKKLEPGAPTSTKRFEVLKTFNECGIRAMPRMEPACAFLNDSCEHLEDYFTKAEEAGCTHFLGDPFHHTVHAEEIVKTFYSIGIDFDRMWEATTEYQILGSYVFEHAMYHAKKHGLKASCFNYHSVPYNDNVVCCGVDDLFPNYHKYSMINFLNELITNKKMSFEEFDEKYYGYELNPGFRERLKRAINMENISWDNPDFMEGTYVSREEPENFEWKFDPRKIGQGYTDIERLFGMDGVAS